MPICPAFRSALGPFDLGTGAAHAQLLAGQFAQTLLGLGEIRNDLLGGHALRFLSEDNKVVAGWFKYPGLLAQVVAIERSSLAFVP